MSDAAQILPVGLETANRAFASIGDVPLGLRSVVKLICIVLGHNAGSATSFGSGLAFGAFFALVGVPQLIESGKDFQFSDRRFCSAGIIHAPILTLSTLSTKNAPDPKSPGRTTPTEVDASNVSRVHSSTTSPSSPSRDARPMEAN